MHCSIRNLFFKYRSHLSRLFGRRAFIYSSSALRNTSNNSGNTNEGKGKRFFFRAMSCILTLFTCMIICFYFLSSQCLGFICDIFSPVSGILQIVAIGFKSSVSFIYRIRVFVLVYQFSLSISKSLLVNILKLTL